MKSKRNVFANRATLRSDCEQKSDCTAFECCNEQLVFAMQDTKHQFSLGLSTVLECLMVAEKEGYVPPLPAEWWYQIR